MNYRTHSTQTFRRPPPIAAANVAYVAGRSAAGTLVTGSPPQGCGSLIFTSKTSPSPHNPTGCGMVRPLVPHPHDGNH